MYSGYIKAYNTHYNNILPLQHERPDMIIGSKNKVKGNIKFEGLLRIDGTIEGRIIAPLDVRHIYPPFLFFITFSRSEPNI